MDSRVETWTPNDVPLLVNSTNHNTKSVSDDDLRSFRMGLRWCALDHSSLTGKAISCAVFFVFAVAIPVVISFFAVLKPLDVRDGDDRCSEEWSVITKLVQLPESTLAAISFLTLTGFFHRYSFRQLLFLDGLRHDSPSVRRGYSRELERAFKYLTYITLPSFSVEVAHKLIFFSHVTITFPHLSIGFPSNAVTSVASMASWVYRTGLFLLVCVLFRLTCELQILRLEGFRKTLEGCSSDPDTMFREHMRIKQQLLVTSHRYRVFIVGCLITVSVSQLSALMVVLTSVSKKNFCNSGDLVVCSIVQLSGFFMCLLGAARITHRARGVVAIVSQWHMIMTCSRSDMTPSEEKKIDIDNPSLTPSGDYNPSPSELQVSMMTNNVESRKALVMYLEHNNGGITLFGFVLDRGLLHTLFAFEMSLVLWIFKQGRCINMNNFPFFFL